MVFRKFFRPSVDPFNLLKSQPKRPLISPKTLKKKGLLPIEWDHCDALGGERGRKPLVSDTDWFTR